MMQSLEIIRVGKGLPDHSFSDHTPSRHEKSLGLLTTKFVTLLQEAKDGVLDLKVVSTSVVCHGHAWLANNAASVQNFIVILPR